jgi:hypothetical protein
MVDAFRRHGGLGTAKNTKQSRCHSDLREAVAWLTTRKPLALVKGVVRDLDLALDLVLLLEAFERQACWSIEERRREASGLYDLISPVLWR